MKNSKYSMKSNEDDEDHALFNYFLMKIIYKLYLNNQLEEIMRFIYYIL